MAKPSIYRFGKLYTDVRITMFTSNCSHSSISHLCSNQMEFMHFAIFIEKMQWICCTPHDRYIHTHTHTNDLHHRLCINETAFNQLFVNNYPLCCYSHTIPMCFFPSSTLMKHSGAFHLQPAKHMNQENYRCTFIAVRFYWQYDT